MKTVSTTLPFHLIALIYNNKDTHSIYNNFIKYKHKYTYFSLEDPTIWAITMLALIAKSTGINWPLFSPLQCMERITPFPEPTKSPIGPLRLSTQPSTGSSTAGITEKRRSR